MVEGETIASIPNTIKRYEEDTYLFKGNSMILLEQIDENNPKLGSLVLSETIFHPQGGGQPSDSGIIFNELNQFTVNSINIENGHIFHNGTYLNEGGFGENCEVNLEIDEEKRTKNARIHTGGHLLSFVFENEGYGDPGTKGYHFPVGSYIQIGAHINPKDRPQVLLALEHKCNQIIKSVPEEDKVWTKVCTYEEGKELMGGKVPLFIEEGAEMRLVKLCSEDAYVPCGGTHLTHLSQLGYLKIRKFKKQRKELVICYDVLDNIDP